FFTLDAATDIAFGEPTGLIKQNGDGNEYLKQTGSILRVNGILGTLPWLVHLVHKCPFNLMMPNEGGMISFGVLM
ncbi:hypothetical protein B0H67DRAFT_442131, partial [Lasiosphaeris hirsuta]